MKKYFLTLVILIASLSISFSAESNVEIGNITDSGEYVITASQSDLQTIFSRYNIFKDWEPTDFEITYDNQTELYHVVATGDGIEKNDGKTASLRVYITESANVLSWNTDLVKGTNMSAAEACIGSTQKQFRFKAGGGCDCEGQVLDICNHSIER